MRDPIRESLRCLDCGSNRFATFRGSLFVQPPSYKKRPQFYGSPHKNYKGNADKVNYQSDYDLTKANEQFKKLLDDGEESGKEGAKEEPKIEKLKAEKSKAEKSKAEKSKAEKSKAEKSKAEKSKAEKSKAEKLKDHEPSTEEIAEMLHKAAIKGASSAPIPIYDKSNSFFDDISCESKEKTEGTYNSRDDWELQRSRNQETFGLTGRRPQYVPQRPFYPQSISRGHYPPRKWNNERARNQQTFGDYGMYDSFGGPSGGYYPRKHSYYGGFPGHF